MFSACNRYECKVTRRESGPQWSWTRICHINESCNFQPLTQICDPKKGTIYMNLINHHTCLINLKLPVQEPQQPLQFLILNRLLRLLIHQVRADLLTIITTNLHSCGRSSSHCQSASPSSTSAQNISVIACRIASASGKMSTSYWRSKWMSVCGKACITLFIYIEYSHLIQVCQCLVNHLLTVWSEPLHLLLQV